MLYRLGIGVVALIAAACTSRSDAADTTEAAAAAESQQPEATPPAPPPAASEAAMIEQIPATAVFSVNGPKNHDQWNGSWNIKSDRLACAINMYGRMLNFDIIDEDESRPDFQELRIGTTDGPDAGGSTSKLSINLALDRPGPNLSIETEAAHGDTGTLTVVSNAGGNARLTVKAVSGDGIRFEGEFTCVPKPSQ